MSANMNEAIERQRQMLYAEKTDNQLMMIALHYLLEANLKGFHAGLQRELYDRYAERETTRCAACGCRPPL
jgi:hypothetical protein